MLEVEGFSAAGLKSLRPKAQGLRLQVLRLAGFQVSRPRIGIKAVKPSEAG